ncbi:MAG: UDP-N-acetylmuramate--L-alanine ligase [bacterium]
MRIHFIGIGGIGVSALARYYLEKGHKVSGSDLVSSEITQALKKKGAKIFIGPHLARTVPANADLVIYSPAVQKSNPELKTSANNRGRTPIIMSYPEALGELTKEHFTIAVSGTHGKSTTTSMLGLLLAKAGLDPTVIVGTKIKEFANSNCRVGKSKSESRNDGTKLKKRTKSSLPYLVIEADEHFASFLNYWPKIIVLTNIEADHLDYYQNLNNILKAFKRYIGHLPKDGLLIANKDDKNIKNLAREAIPSRFYSVKQPEAKKLRKILKVPGEHNVSNALAVLTVARILGIKDKAIFSALASYKGCWRRFEEKTYKIPNTKYKIQVISDYGHHPTEVLATLKAAREKYPKKKIWCVFQPHQYQRTYFLFKDFVKSFRLSPIDKIIITDIYDVAGREEKKIKGKVNSEKLVKTAKRKNVIYMSKENILDYLKENISDFEVLIIMGAGDIYKIISNF